MASQLADQHWLLQRTIPDNVWDAHSCVCPRLQLFSGHSLGGFKSSLPDHCVLSLKAPAFTGQPAEELCSPVLHGLPEVLATHLLLVHSAFHIHCIRYMLLFTLENEVKRKWVQ